MIRLAASVALCLPLSGCFFVFIPGSVVGAVSDSVTGDRGEHCVAESVAVGARLRLPSGASGTVTSLSGHSYRCNDARRPIRAEIRPESAA